jgi:hypothetical protein
MKSSVQNQRYALRIFSERTGRKCYADAPYTYVHTDNTELRCEGATDAEWSLLHYPQELLCAHTEVEIERERKL